MSTGLLEQRANYPRSQYEYGFGGHGTTDADSNGCKEIDCSNLLNRMLQDAGYNIPYKTTAQLSDSGRPTPKVTMTVNDFRAYDVCLEVSGTPPAGKLSTGTKLEVLEQKNVGNVTYARGKILSGAVKDGARKTRETGAEVWFAYLKDGAPYQNSEPKDIWKADKIVERLRPNYWQGKVKATAVNKLDLYGDPAAPQNGQPVGPRLGTMKLIPGSVVEFDSKD